MKSFKTLLLLLFLFAFSYPVQSQDNVLEQRIENMVKKLDAKVQLTDKQEQDILTKLLKDWLPLLEEYQSLNENTAKADRDELMNNISEMKDEIIDEFLTEDQKIRNKQ